MRAGVFFKDSLGGADRSGRVPASSDARPRATREAGLRSASQPPASTTTATHAPAAATRQAWVRPVRLTATPRSPIRPYRLLDDSKRDVGSR